MKAARIEYTLDGDTRRVVYESDADGENCLLSGSVLSVEVRDADDAAELVAAIEKVGRPVLKRKPRKLSPAPVAPDPLPAADGGTRGEVPLCSAHSDGQHVVVGGTPCVCGWLGYPPEAVTPPPVGRKRAKEIVAVVEGKVIA